MCGVGRVVEWLMTEAVKGLSFTSKKKIFGVLVQSFSVCINELSCIAALPFQVVVYSTTKCLNADSVKYILVISKHYLYR